MKPRLYDRNMGSVDVLENATQISYVHKLNDLYSAKFKLPVMDAKNSLCSYRSIVDIFDGDTSAGKYRIIGSPETDISARGSYIEYNCEHAIAFLMDDVIDGSISYGDGQTIKWTEDIINDILSKQTVQRWQLGTCDWHLYSYKYTFENTNLLDMLFSIPKAITDRYHWTYDTTTYPWTINLVQRSLSYSCGVNRGTNLVELRRSVDPSSFANRLYCRGKDDLTISSVNSGLNYIEDASSISSYGLVCGHYIDKSEADASMLKAKAQYALASSVGSINPKYSVRVVDLYKTTGDEWYNIEEGKMVHLQDASNGINVSRLVTEVRKDDVDGDPLDMSITLDNAVPTTSAALSIENLTYKITHGMI